MINEAGGTCKTEFELPYNQEVVFLILVKLSLGIFLIQICLFEN